MEFNEELDFSETRKELNRELKKVARGGYSPSQALECVYLMWQSLLCECANNDEIMKRTAKMISECAKWQVSITQSEAGITAAELTALLKAAAERKYYLGFGAETEEQDDE